MKHKRLVYYFLGISVSLIMSLPVLNVIFAYKQGKPVFRHVSGKVLFSTDNLEALVNYMIYKTLHLSLNSAQVVAGKEHFLFLGNNFAGVIDKTTGAMLYKKQDIDRWVSQVQKLQNWYEDQGMAFVIVIAPNKHTVYSDKLPDNLHYEEGATATDAIVAAAIEKGVHILDLKQSLREKKRDKQLYFDTDTHWNNYGASVGYKETMKYVNMVYGKHYQPVHYRMKKIVSKGGGDLARLLKIKYFLSDNNETDYHFVFDKKSHICSGEIKADNLLTECTPGIRKKFNYYVVNETAPNKEKLLYVCDSFGLENSQLYLETFRTVWRFHLSYTNGAVLDDFMHKHKPDVVIYQIVERDIGNHSVVDDLPNNR
jgi:hypothetical protein